MALRDQSLLFKFSFLVLYYIGIIRSSQDSCCALLPLHILIATGATAVLDTTAISKLSSLNSQLMHDINVLHYTNAAGSVGIT